MLFIFTLVLLLLMRSFVTEKPTPPPDIQDDLALTIVNTGIFALTPDAMGITFYVHLVNNKPFNLDVATRMWECCEIYDEGEVDCSHMHLMGGYKGLICPGQASNVTLFYPNLYVYNRVGECLVGIWYRDPDGNVEELRTKVNFDTTLTPREVASSIIAYYDSEVTRARKCVYIDEDPLDKCKPVDCSRKYNGQRLFYSNVDRRCVAAPKCNKTKSNNARNVNSSEQPTVNLPNLVYAPEGNMCDNLETIIKEEDIRTLNSGRGVDQDLHPSNEYDFIVCHNGNKSLFTGRCTCHEGWSSTTNHIRPTTLMVHLCTVSLYETKTFDDALEDMVYTVRQVAPCFMETIYSLPFYRLPLLLFGSMTILSIILSIAFICIYKGCSDSSSANTYFAVEANNKYKDKNHMKYRDEFTNYDYKDIGNPVTTDNMFSSNEPDDSSLRYDDFSFIRNLSSIGQKTYDYVPKGFKQPTLSYDFYSQTIPYYKAKGCSTARSMSPREKIKFLGQLEERTLNELEPLMLEESLQRSIINSKNEEFCTNPFKNISRPSESTLVAGLWNHNLKPHQCRLKSRKRNIAAQSKRQKRIAEASSFSRSMAQLTYSSLPTSDSLLSVEESDTSNTESDEEQFSNKLNTPVCRENSD